MKTVPRIQIVLMRVDGRVSSAKIAGDHITVDMLDVAEDLLHTLTTGQRPPIKGLYELCATAFGTTRQDAKKRLIGASYGQKGSVKGLRAAVKNPDWSWPPLHNIPPKKKKP